MGQASLSGYLEIVSLLGFGLKGIKKALAAEGCESSWELEDSGTSLLWRWASFYRRRKGSWDPYNYGIGPIIKEASMRGGKPLPLYGNP